YLLNPREDGPALRRYLQAGEQSGVPLRYLPSHRPVWYLPEKRAAADIWVAAFSRATLKCLLNTSSAKSLTCFHGLYAQTNYENLGPLMTLYLNSSWGRQAFLRVNRFYGDGLNKLEPKDLEALPCPEMPKQTAREAANLRRQLVAMERLPVAQRRQAVDRLTSTWLDVPGALEI
ncbi:MAG TPA: hypothetical protein VNT26_11535, partial [Candidatus Sulfotelmatobacter sp.]|nr:hypothetical protein [Candidatus Sulfotelmatobacter sp.]